MKACVIDARARRIVRWRLCPTARAACVLDAMEQALHDHRPSRSMGSRLMDRGSHYLALRCSERLAEAGVEPSVGSVGDSYDNALAETINGPTYLPPKWFSPLKAAAPIEM